MNTCDNGGQPIGEAPELARVKYPSVHEVTYYQARCTSCGVIATDYGDFSALSDGGSAIEYARDCCGWFERVHDDGTVELLCMSCRRCEICGSEKAYEVNAHLVCEAHEDHQFEAAS